MFTYDPYEDHSEEYARIDAMLFAATTAEEIRSLYFEKIRNRLKMTQDEVEELERDMLFKIMNTMKYGKTK